MNHTWVLVKDYFQKSELSDIHKPLLTGGALRAAASNVCVGIGKIEIVYDSDSNIGMDFTFSGVGSRLILPVFILTFLGHGMRKNGNKILGR